MFSISSRFFLNTKLVVYILMQGDKASIVVSSIGQPKMPFMIFEMF